MQLKKPTKIRRFANEKFTQAIINRDIACSIVSGEEE